jgi:hypothetical protein
VYLVIGVILYLRKAKFLFFLQKKVFILLKILGNCRKYWHIARGKKAKNFSGTNSLAKKNGGSFTINEK